MIMSCTQRVNNFLQRFTSAVINSELGNKHATDHAMRSHGPAQLSVPRSAKVSPSFTSVEVSTLETSSEHQSCAGIVAA